MSNNVISIAEWKAKRQVQAQQVPIYHVVPDLTQPCGWRLELVETMSFEEFKAHLD